MEAPFACPYHICCYTTSYISCTELAIIMKPPETAKNMTALWIFFNRVFFFSATDSESSPQMLVLAAMLDLKIIKILYLAKCCS